MAVPDLLSAQRDFSAGELDPEMKRADDLPIYRAGGRQMSDFRITNARIIQQRPGRRALYLQTGRVDQVSVSPTLTFDLCFGGDGYWRIRDASGAEVASNHTYPWTAATVDQIVWTKVNVNTARTDVVATFPGMKPQVASFDGTNWGFSNFAFSVDGTGAALVPFLRVAALGATMQPSATAAAGAAVDIFFSTGVLLSPQHNGTLFRFAGRRVRIDNVVSPASANCTAIDAFLHTQQLTLAPPDGAATSGIEGYSLGQVVEGSLSGAIGEVVGINIGAGVIAVQLTNFASGFIASAAGPPVITELVEGPNAKSKVTAVVNIAPLPAVSWDEQVVSDARGWPQSCFTDASRLGFCDLPGTPEAVLWSVTGAPYNFSIGALATDAICELIAGKPRVYHVGPWIDEIVFTDQGLFYIPIGQTNPLKPGSVTFQHFSPEPPSTAKPVFTSDGYLFVNFGRNSIKAIMATGAAFSTKPYAVQDISEYHRHLFAGAPKAISISTGDSQFPERYVYVVNADGSVAAGRYESAKQWVGWVPWRGDGAVNWISSLRSAVRFVSVYPVLGMPAGVSVAEALDDTEYLDGAVPINAVPAAIAPPALHGPFWWMPLASVELMDGVRPLGTHTIDPLGFVTPAYAGEDLTIATITGGLPYEPFFEPFIPNAQPGDDKKQRTIRRSLGRLIVSVKNSTGFVMAALYSGPAGPALPAPGSIQRQFRVPPWNQGEDQSQPPTLREDTYRQRFSGRAFDQRVAVFKDKPGPLQIIEVAAEASV